MNVPSQQEIEAVYAEATAAETEGSKFPGMTYEQGVMAAIEWMQHGGPDPLED